jgi:cytosine/adenosine deaminase-related metal-dependent hydrolase
MKSFRADYVFPVSADPIKNGIVTVDDSGKIISLTDHNSLPPERPVEYVSGIICPGFINTHCHVELSHLRNQINQHTGLVKFIIEVQKTRGADPGAVLDAAYSADEEMYTNGIVAVGDIANTDASIAVKKASKLYYHSFIETFGFRPAQAEEVFAKALGLLSEFKHAQPGVRR